MVHKHIGEPIVKKRLEQPYVGIPIVATVSEQDRVNSLIAELVDWLKTKEIKPAGRPFFRYWCAEGLEKKYKMEVAVPVMRMVTGDARVVGSCIPGGCYVTAIHKGHPDDVEKSLNALEQWALREELNIDKRWEGEAEIWNGRFEFFVPISKEASDWNKWAIEIAFLLTPDDAA
ncbi:transcriptional regulator [Planococcus versutus]|uniref:Transcriptional regulator n=1 Tax=Planococcus versutus TaxID=1302659 RepID=A0A1B1S373_9BACL|nr:transcriptional regulator [Planococcus versutus]